MDRTQIAELLQPIQAECYYVRHEKNWWGYFTLHDNGLIQCYTDFGVYAYRWDDTNLKTDLPRFSIEYLAGKFEQWVRFTGGVNTPKAERAMELRIKAMLTHLWPLFIEKLKAQAEAEKVR